MRIQRGGQGVRTPPPGKSQVIWISIGNKLLDPPPLEKVGPPPPGKCWTPSGTLKNDRFLWNWPFDFCKISWGLKKTQKNVVRAFFVRLTWNPLTKIPGSAHGPKQPRIYRGFEEMIEPWSAGSAVLNHMTKSPWEPCTQRDSGGRCCTKN